MYIRCRTTNVDCVPNPLFDILDTRITRKNSEPMEKRKKTTVFMQKVLNKNLPRGEQQKNMSIL